MARFPQIGVRMADQEKEPRFRSKYPRPKREDGRVQFLAYLPPKLVQRIRVAAINRGEHAYQWVERELTGVLDRLDDPAFGLVQTDLTDPPAENGSADAAPTKATGKERS